jgi:hypothetical protein
VAALQHTPLSDERLLTSASSKDGSDDCGSRCSTSSKHVAALQHTPLFDERLLTSASSKDGSDDCGSRCSTSSSQQLFAQADQHPAGQQLESAPANNPGSTMSFLQEDDRCSSSSTQSTDNATTEQEKAREGSDGVVIVTVHQHRAHHASDGLKQQQADTVLQGADTDDEHQQAMEPEVDQHAMLQLWQQQVQAAEAAVAAAHTALQVYQQQLLQLGPQAGAMKPREMLQAEQQCWVQRTAGGPVSHPIVLDDDEDQWVWTEHSTQLVVCRIQLQTAVALIRSPEQLNRLLSPS